MRGGRADAQPAINSCTERNLPAASSLTVKSILEQDGNASHLIRWGCGGRARRRACCRRARRCVGLHELPGQARGGRWLRGRNARWRRCRRRSRDRSAKRLPSLRAGWRRACRGLQMVAQACHHPSAAPQLHQSMTSERPTSERLCGHAHWAMRCWRSRDGVHAERCRCSRQLQQLPANRRLLRALRRQGRGGRLRRSKRGLQRSARRPRGLRPRRQLTCEGLQNGKPHACTSIIKRHSWWNTGQGVSHIAPRICTALALQNFRPVRHHMTRKVEKTPGIGCTCICTAAVCMPSRADSTRSGRCRSPPHAGNGNLC